MIPRESLQAALAALEPYAAHPATGALHDPIWRLLDGPDDAQERALAAALEAGAVACAHPAAPAVRAAVGPHLGLTPRTIEDVLAAYGPLPAGADPVHEVERRLADAVRERTRLEVRAAELELRANAAATAAGRLAVAGAVAAGFAVLGWLAATGLWKIDWIEPPAPPPAGGPGASER